MDFAFSKTPTPVLQPYIERFAEMEFPTPLRDSHLPGVGAVAAFSFRGECEIDNRYLAPTSAFTGLHDALRRHQHRNGHAVLLTMFTPAGASAFSNVPLREVSTGTTALANLTGDESALNTLEVHLQHASDHSARVALVESFFVSQLRKNAPDPLVAAAITRLKQSATAIRIRDLSQHIGLSQSALERRFQRGVGISPKKFAMLVRLQRAVRLSKTGARLSTIAHDAGYFDHSHFTNDFHRVTGQSPEAYLGANRAERMSPATR